MSRWSRDELDTVFVIPRMSLSLCKKKPVVNTGFSKDLVFSISYRVGRRRLSDHLRVHQKRNTPPLQ